MDEVSYLAGPSMDKINMRPHLLLDSYIYGTISIWHHPDSPPISTGSPSIHNHLEISP